MVIRRCPRRRGSRRILGCVLSTWKSARSVYRRRNAHVERAQLVEFVQDDYPRVLAALTFACGDPARAEDALQEALATACQHRGEIQHPRAWVTRVALNHARSSVRRLGAEQRAHDRASRQRATAAETGTGRLDESTVDALQQLPARQREIVVLHYLLDLSVDDVATTLDISTGTVKTQLHRARETLRTRLKAELRTKESDHVR